MWGKVRRELRMLENAAHDSADVRGIEGGSGLRVKNPARQGPTQLERLRLATGFVTGQHVG